MNRTVTVKKGEKTLYTSSCTISGNEVTGCINPFPYVNRKLRKMGLKVWKMDESDGNITLHVREG